MLYFYRQMILPKMKCFLLVILISSFSILSWGQGSLKVTIEEIKTADGQVVIALYDSKKSFPGDSPVKWESVTAKKGEVTVQFDDLPPGVYALSVYHDENNNEKLDKNILGIPKESFGFSNNAMGTFGAPSFDDAKVALKDNAMEIVISLKSM